MTEIFYTFVITSIIGLILASFKIAYSSKCSRIKCGCIEIIRNVDVEERIDEHQLERNNKDTNNVIDNNKDNNNV